MSVKLRPWLEKFFQFVSSKQAGDIVTEAEILAATTWKPATLEAHRNKNAIAPFLGPAGPGRHRILRDGSTIAKGEIATAFTQKRPGLLVLSRGMKAKGTKDTYELQSYIGEGAVAHVWVAIGSDGRKYAIKVMNPRADLLEPSILENVRLRFAKESKRGVAVLHDHIVTYRDAGEISRHPFLVMDLAEDSLAATIQKGKVSLRDSLRIIGDCAVGLHHLHGLDCVHRDVKPANILRFPDRYVLGDLGIVHWSDLNKAFTSAGTITRASVQLGSWHYMPPEQRRSAHHVTATGDIYALGISWYEMLTGGTPDPGEVGAQAFEDPTSDAEANELIRKMLRFKATDRPSAAEVGSTVAAIRARLG